MRADLALFDRTRRRVLNPFSVVNPGGFPHPIAYEVLEYANTRVPFFAKCRRGELHKICRSADFFEKFRRGSGVKRSAQDRLDQIRRPRKSVRCLEFDAKFFQQTLQVFIAPVLDHDPAFLWRVENRDSRTQVRR